MPYTQKSFCPKIVCLWNPNWQIFDLLSGAWEQRISTENRDQLKSMLQKTAGLAEKKNKIKQSLSSVTEVV